MVRLRQYMADHKVGICIIVIVLVSLALFALGVWRLGWGWTGFLQDTTQTITTGKITAEIHPRTFWDVLELAIIPGLVALVVFLLNRAQRQIELEIASQRAKTEQDIAADRQRQAALDAYFDRMKDLLLKEGLRESQEGAEVRSIARTRTLAVLRSLDRIRKGQALRFLYESGLINRDDPIVDLDGADLMGANLIVPRHFRVLGPDRFGLTGWGLDLSKANLSGANLIKAELHGADLSETDLSNAKLDDARMFQVNLSGADLSKAMLSRAKLLDADLSGANLTNTFFYGADLTNAIVDLEQIMPCQFSDDDTIMPDGTRYKEWVKRKDKEAV